MHPPNQVTLQATVCESQPFYFCEISCDSWFCELLKLCNLDLLVFYLIITKLCWGAFLSRGRHSDYRARNLRDPEQRRWERVTNSPG